MNRLWIVLLGMVALTIYYHIPRPSHGGTPDWRDANWDFYDEIASGPAD